jgi:hypothetical protein
VTPRREILTAAYVADELRKRCKTCGVEKPAADFYRHPQSADGLFGSCKACVRPASAARTRSESGRGAKAKWRAANALKIAAHSAVAEALKHGRMVRRPCEVCGEGKSQAHHDDYAKPLEVIWLCAEHHGERHRMLRRGAA